MFTSKHALFIILKSKALSGLHLYLMFKFVVYFAKTHLVVYKPACYKYVATQLLFHNGFLCCHSHAYMLHVNKQTCSVYEVRKQPSFFAEEFILNNNRCTSNC